MGKNTKQNKKVKVSFEELKKKFLLSDIENEIYAVTSDGSDHEKLDSSFFDFDVNHPEAILIAGSSTSTDAGCKACTSTDSYGCVSSSDSDGPGDAAE